MLPNTHGWPQFLLEWPDCGSYFSFKGLVHITCPSAAPQDLTITLGALYVSLKDQGIQLEFPKTWGSVTLYFTLFYVS